MKNFGLKMLILESELWFKIFERLNLNQSFEFEFLDLEFENRFRNNG